MPGVNVCPLCHLHTPRLLDAFKSATFSSCRPYIAPASVHPRVQDRCLFPSPLALLCKAAAVRADAHHLHPLHLFPQALHRTLEFEQDLTRRFANLDQDAEPEDAFSTGGDQPRLAFPWPSLGPSFGAGSSAPSACRGPANLFRQAATKQVSCEGRQSLSEGRPQQQSLPSPITLDRYLPVSRST